MLPFLHNTQNNRLCIYSESSCHPTPSNTTLVLSVAASTFRSLYIFDSVIHISRTNSPDINRFENRSRAGLRRAAAANEPSVAAAKRVALADKIAAKAEAVAAKKAAAADKKAVKAEASTAKKVAKTDKKTAAAAEKAANKAAATTNGPSASSTQPVSSSNQPAATSNPAVIPNDQPVSSYDQPVATSSQAVTPENKPAAPPLIPRTAGMVKHLPSASGLPACWTQDMDRFICQCDSLTGIDTATTIRGLRRKFSEHLALVSQMSIPPSL